MVDPGTGAIVAAGVLSTKGLLTKVLGPTADYVGGEIEKFVEKRHANIRRVLKAAARKLPQEINPADAVPPRVLKSVIDDASFSDEPIVAEYFGGVLAASRSEDGKDDRGVGIAAMIGRLSIYQLKAHYGFYTAIRELHKGKNVNPGDENELARFRIHVPWFVLEQICSIKQMDQEAKSAIAYDVSFGLRKEALIADFRGGTPEYLEKKAGISVERAGLVVSPSQQGIMLFLWAHGHGTRSPGFFFSKDFTAERHIDFDLDKCSPA